MGASSHLNCLVDILQPERRTRILDVGANPINDCPYGELRDAGLADVWGFEPQASAFEALQKIKGEHEHYLPHAIGDGTEAQLNVYRSSGFTSLLPINTALLDYLGQWHRQTRLVEQVSFQTRRLDDIDELPPPDLLKIDVQGAEAMIFRNGAEKLAQSVAVVTEVSLVPLYVGQPLMHEQARILDDYGFLFHKFLFLKSVALQSPLVEHVNRKRLESQVVDGDAVFIRSLLDPGSVSDEQLKHLAICADSVFRSFDLVFKCLTLLMARGVLTEAAALDYARLTPHGRAED